MDVVKLIRGVKCREPLWDRKHAYYHDRTVTMALWDDVAFSLGVDSETARTKWKGLRDTFRGELRKLHRTMIGGKPRKSTNWEYFDEMDFVKEQIYSNKRHLEELMNHSKTPRGPLNGSSSSSPATVKSPNSHESTDGEDSFPQMPSLQGSSSPETSDDDGLDLTTRPRLTQNSSAIVTTESDGDKEPKPHVPPIKPQRDVEDDEDFNFLMSLLPQLRCLPTTRNLLVRLKLQEVLYNEMMALHNFCS